MGGTLQRKKKKKNKAPQLDDYVGTSGGQSDYFSGQAILRKSLLKPMALIKTNVNYGAAEEMPPVLPPLSPFASTG